MWKSVLILTSLLGSAMPAWSKDAHSISVSGDCLRDVIPDRTMVTLTAETRDKDAGKASEGAISQYNKIRDRVKKMNLKNLELETSEFNVNEDVEWNQNVRKSLGFKARMGLRVTSSDISRMGEVMALASELKVQDVSSLQSFVSRELLRAERESCLEEAFKNARSKAEKLAKSSGQKLGPALSITEDMASHGPIPPGPRPLMAAKSIAMDQSSSSPEIETGTSKFSVSVQAIFEMN